MAAKVPQDKSNGYEEIADRFMLARNPQIGPATVREWSKTLPTGSSILDLGCGNGIPITQILIEEGFAVYGIDASAKMIAAFRANFPHAHAECAAVEGSAFFGRTFDGVVAWGLMFLLPPDIQTILIGKVASVLNSGGKFLFTSPRDAFTWKDIQTGRECLSLGLEKYHDMLRAAGLVLVGEASDEGENYYYFVSKP